LNIHGLLFLRIC